MTDKKLHKILDKTSLEAAPELLGWIMCRELPKGIVKGRIVEVEAYLQDDPASHSFVGLTKRTAPMFKKGGHIYVYFTYGTHYCINIVTGRDETGEAVLIRAVEPLEGKELFHNNRGITNEIQLTNGPGKLTQAFGITSTDLSGRLLGKDTVWLEAPENEIDIADILVSPRIGIKKATEHHWRFYLKNNPYVSKLTKNPL